MQQKWFTDTVWRRGEPRWWIWHRTTTSRYAAVAGGGDGGRRDQWVVEGGEYVVGDNDSSAHITIAVSLREAARRVIQCWPAGDMAARPRDTSRRSGAAWQRGAERQAVAGVIRAVHWTRREETKDYRCVVRRWLHCLPACPPLRWLIFFDYADTSLTLFSISFSRCWLLPRFRRCLFSDAAFLLSLSAYADIFFRFDAFSFLFAYFSLLRHDFSWCRFSQFSAAISTLSMLLHYLFSLFSLSFAFASASSCCWYFLLYMMFCCWLSLCCFAIDYFIWWLSTSDITSDFSPVSSSLLPACRSAPAFRLIARPHYHRLLCWRLFASSLLMMLPPLMMLMPRLPLSFSFAIVFFAVTFLSCHTSAMPASLSPLISLLIFLRLIFFRLRCHWCCFCLIIFSFMLSPAICRHFSMPCSISFSAYRFDISPLMLSLAADFLFAFRHIFAWLFSSAMPCWCHVFFARYAVFCCCWCLISFDSAALFSLSAFLRFMMLMLSLLRHAAVFRCLLRHFRRLLWWFPPRHFRLMPLIRAVSASFASSLRFLQPTLIFLSFDATLLPARCIFSRCFDFRCHFAVIFLRYFHAACCHMLPMPRYAAYLLSHCRVIYAYCCWYAAILPCHMARYFY